MGLTTGMEGADRTAAGEKGLKSATKLIIINKRCEVKLLELNPLGGKIESDCGGSNIKNHWDGSELIIARGQK